MGPFGPFPKDSSDYPVAIAVSGGADSLCLALLAHQWRRHCVALIVDHGLRHESADESLRTRACLRRHGISAHILQINSLVGACGVQARARAARYDVMTAWCRDNGALDLLVGHHLQDQAETWLLRKDRKSGARGLAAMATDRFGQDIRVLRPLLDVPPQRLRATLRERGVDWIEDRSNDDTRFLRVKIRKSLTDETLSAAYAESKFNGQRRELTEKAQANSLAAIVPHPFGFIKIIGDLPPAEIVARLWQGVSGAQWVPDIHVMERLRDRPKAMTYNGVWFYKKTSKTLQEEWYLTREPAAARQIISATDDMIMAGTIWDRRWRLNASLPAGFTIQRLGSASSRFKTREIQSKLIAALPAIWDGPNLAAVPAFGAYYSDALRGVKFCAWRGAPVTDASLWGSSRG